MLDSRGSSIAMAGLATAGLASLGGGSGCSSSPANCSPEGTLVVQVTDQNVDSPTDSICGATVTAQKHGGAAVTLTPEGLDGSAVNCRYETNVAPGTYTVIASAPGYISLSQTQTFSEVNCVTSAPLLVIGLFQSQSP